MISYSIYSVENGQVFSTGIAQTQQDVDAMVQDGQAAIYQQASKYQYVENNQLVTPPPKPDGAYKFDYNSKEWVLDYATADRQQRQKRDQLLNESDWTQLSDVPLTNKSEWATYRQQLRDITQQSGYPYDVIYPNPPQQNKT